MVAAVLRVRQEDVMGVRVITPAARRRLRVYGSEAAVVDSNEIVLDARLSLASISDIDELAASVLSIADDGMDAAISSKPQRLQRERDLQVRLLFMLSCFGE